MELVTRRSCMHRVLGVHTNARTVSLAPYTTLGIGGNAAYFSTVSSETELRDAVFFAQKNNLSIFVLGGGSNTLVSDSGYDGLVIHMNMKGVSYEEQGEHLVTCVCAGGESWDDVVVNSTKRGLSGLENLSGIPGSAGASPVQNIGAYGVEVGDHITYVEVFDIRTHTIKKLSHDECRFGYRDSIFKSDEGRVYIVTHVAFTLSKTFTPAIEYKDVQSFFSERKLVPRTASDIRDAILFIRSQKFPDMRTYGTAGSFFKNPIISNSEYQKLVTMYPDMPHFPADLEHVKIPLAWILDKVCNLKGFRKGKVFLFDRQPLVLVTEVGATSDDVYACAEHVQKIVFEKTNIIIEKEVVCLK